MWSVGRGKAPHPSLAPAGLDGAPEAVSGATTHLRDLASPPAATGAGGHQGRSGGCSM